MYFVYILYSESSIKYYVGSCEDIAIRLGQHNSGRNKSTKHGIPWEIKYIEQFENRVSAYNREMEIKKTTMRGSIHFFITMYLMLSMILTN